MIKKPFIQNKPPYVPPFNRFDDRPVSKQIYKPNNSSINAEMSSVIISANPTEILNFFAQNSFTSYVDNDGNSPVHLIIIIDDNKLNQQQKIDLINQLIVPPFNLTFDSTNNRGETPLHIAVKKQFANIVSFLIEKGANPNKINFYHQNCLHLAMIPNIKSCEQPTQPNALIEVDQSLEDKNIFYNEILSVFYNQRDKFDKVIGIINAHVEFIFTNYYDNYKHSKIMLINDKIVGEEITPLEAQMRDIQNKITENILDSKNSESTIKKNISYYIVNALTKMTKIIGDFIPNAINEININSNNTLEVGKFDFDKILFGKILEEIKLYQVPNSTQKFKLSQDEYLTSRQQLVEKTLKKEMESINDILASLVDNKANPAQLANNNNAYNAINLYTNLITNPAPVTKDDVTTYYNDITAKIASVNDIHYANNKDKVDAINKILPNHINNLNLWLAYENVKSGKFIDNWSDVDNISKIIKDDNTTYKPLDFFLLINGGTNAVCKKINIIDLNNPNDPNQSEQNDINAKTIGIPNSYNTTNKDFDFIDLLKKNIIEHILTRIDIPESNTKLPNPPNTSLIDKIDKKGNGKTFTEIWTNIYKLMELRFKGLESITESNLYLQTMTTIIQVIDRIIISNIRKKIYLECVKILKTKILDDTDQKFNNYKTQIEKVFDRIIVQSNISIKLEKTINDMISLSIDPTKILADSFNVNDIIDEKNISKIFNYGSPDSVGVKRDELNEIYIKDADEGKYLVHYTSDYNSMQVLSTRQCMRNSTSIIKKLFIATNNGFNPDIFKFDVNGFTPIFYAIKSGNYLLVRQLIESIEKIRNTSTITIYSTSHPMYSVVYQLNKYGQSPIYYAFEQFKSYCTTIKPDWSMINVTFMNNLLLSAQINQNIPKSYYDSYKISVYHLNEFVKAIITDTFYNFTDIINIGDGANLNPSKPFFDQTQKINSIDFYANTSTTINIIDDTWIENDLESIYKFISDINANIIGHKSISHNLNFLKQQKIASNFSDKLKKIKNLVHIFEEKYKPNRIYKYTEKFRPPFDNALNTKN